MDLMLGNKTKLGAKISIAEIEIEGRNGPMRIAMFDEAVPVIGVGTLETLGLKVKSLMNLGQMSKVPGGF